MDWEFWKEIVCFLTIPMLFLAVLIIPFVGLSSYQGHQVCQTLSQGDETHQYQWTFWTGCRVRTSEGYWIHYSDAGIIHLTQEE